MARSPAIASRRLRARQQHAAAGRRVAPPLGESRRAGTARPIETSSGNSTPRSKRAASERRDDAGAATPAVRARDPGERRCPRETAPRPTARRAIVRCALREMPADGRHRRQRQHRVAEPVRRANHDATRRAASAALTPRPRVRRTRRPETCPRTASVAPSVAPAAVHPQPEMRMPPHVHLEHVGAALRQLAHGIRRVGRRQLDRALVDHPVAAAAAAAARTPE